MYQIDYEEIEQDIFQCHNNCREDPSSYITKLKELQPYFKDKIYHHPFEDSITTYEGVDIIEEACQYLKTLKPLDILIYSPELSLACRDHIKDIGPKGLTDHIGSDGSNITDRIEKYCEWDGIVGENLDFGFKEGKNILMNLIMDDGVKERCQRRNIFNKEYKYIGIGVGPHKIYGICTVIAYAKNVRKIGSEPEDVSDWIKKFYYKEKKEEEIDNNNINSENIGNNIERKNNINEYKFIDPDAPDNSISVNITKKIKYINKEQKKYTKKTFLLKNGINHIIEIEE